MRHDRFNTGRSPIRAKYHAGDRPWAFATGKGVFSTPIVGSHETVYAGSADTNFYAIRNGRPQVALQDRRDHRLRRRAGPRRHRHLRLRRRAHLPPPRPHRRQGLDASAPPASRPRASSSTGGRATSPWGPAACSTRATPAAPSTRSTRTAACAGSTRPATRSGRTRRSAGTAASTSARSTSTSTRVNARGRLKWKRGTLGFVTSSPAIGPNGTVYIGSFDGALHALDPKTGADRWSLCDRRPRLRLAGARREQRLRRLGRRVDLRLRSARGAALALRHRRHGALLAGARSRAARHRADPLRRLRQRPALRPRRPDRPPPLVLRHHPARPDPRATATTSTPPRRSAAVASTSAASTGASCSCPTTGACTARTRAATATRAARSAAR